MKTLSMFVKRNILVYTSDRSTVLFSMMTMLIIIGLNLIFLGKNNVDNLIQLVPVGRTNANDLINTWLIAGIIVVNTVTVSTAIMGIMVEDEDKKRISSFLVAPISRFKLTLGYVLSAFIVSFLSCIFALVIFEIYISSIGGTLLSFKESIKVIGIIAINIFSSASCIFFIISFIHTSAAFSAANTLIGTLIGFIIGMYVPMGDLPSMVQQVLKFLPIVCGASLMREVFMNDSITSIFNGQPQVIINKYTDNMGVTISWGGQPVDDLYKVLILLVSGIIFILLSALVLKNRKIADR